MLIEALQALLASDPGMQTFLGTPVTRSDGSNGIFPSQAPDQIPVPYLVIRQVTGEPLQESLQGTGCLTEERWRFTCVGSTYKNAKVFAKYVRGFMLGAVNGNQNVGECFIQGVWNRLEVDNTESLGKGTLFSTVLDFAILYQDFS